MVAQQRKKDDLTGGHIRTDVDSYIAAPLFDKLSASMEINRFVEMLKRFNGDIKAPATSAN